MKSKVVVEVLRDQTEKSLALLTQYFSTKENKVVYSLSEAENLFDKVDGKDIPVYGLMIELDTLSEGKKVNRKLYYRRYKITGSLNDIKANAFKELADIMMGSFLINATRSDDATLEKLSKTKE